MKQNEKSPLPIDSRLNDILKLIKTESMILIKASPGSGKTTRLPWSIAKELGKKIVVLEPRRLAAKLAALRIAQEENLTLGLEIGFHFRFEKNFSENSQLIFYTEGTFLKKFIYDPLINDVDVVILDEFHERHVETDTALALLRSVQTKRDLKIILMSATLDTSILQNIPEAKVIEIEVSSHAVTINYLPNVPSILNQSLESKVKKAILETEGDTLVFVPGMREMIRIQTVLNSVDELKEKINLHFLHSELSKEEQEKVLGESHQRKVILATNIAESSVTIPGIKVVIDSGIQRAASHSAWSGLKFIQDSPVTKSSAIQRTGRAGRTGPGVCHRLYSEQDFEQRREHTMPQLETEDLTGLYLFLSSIVISPLWFVPPKGEKWNKSKELLGMIGALDRDHLTPVGKKMLEYPLDPRLSRILVAGERLKREDKENLLDYICQKIEKDKTGNLFRRLSFYLKSSADEVNWKKCFLCGLIDQVAKFRKKQRDFIHYSGKVIRAHEKLHDLEDGFYIILEITQRQEVIETLEVQEEWFWDMAPFPLIEEEEIEMGEKIKILRKTRLGSIALEESVLKIDWLNLKQETQEKILRQSKPFVEEKLKTWMEGTFYGRLSFWGRIKKIDLQQFFLKLDVKNYFSLYNELEFKNLDSYFEESIQKELTIQDLDQNLPLKIKLKGKKELTIYYPLDMDPYLEAPIQDFYGLMDTPSILQGKVPLTLKLLGPHKRPIQVTRDLKNFWSRTYQEIRKEYLRDYPKHYWPEKPWEADPVLLKSALQLKIKS
jgi:ATP-dependent helicase HrpB